MIFTRHHNALGFKHLDEVTCRISVFVSWSMSELFSKALSRGVCFVCSAYIDVFRPERPPFPLSLERAGKPWCPSIYVTLSGRDWVKRGTGDRI